MDWSSEWERAGRRVLIPVREFDAEYPAYVTVVFWSDDETVKLSVGDEYYNIELETPAQVQALIDALTVALGWFAEQDTP